MKVLCNAKKDVIHQLVRQGAREIVELDCDGQQKGQVYLHIYDLKYDLDRARFTEYQGLHPQIAAEFVVQSRIKPANELFAVHHVGALTPRST